MDATIPDFLEVSASSASSPTKTETTMDSRYHSAMESLTDYASFDESSNPSKADSLLTLNQNGSESLSHNDVTLNASELNANNESQQSFNELANASNSLIKSESCETNNSTEEVDPKSLLANKTIFKTDNPDLSIIEISRSSSKESDNENLVQLVDPATPTEHTAVKAQVSAAAHTTNEKYQAEKSLLNATSTKNTATQFTAPLATFTPQTNEEQKLDKTQPADKEISELSRDMQEQENVAETKSAKKREIIIYDTLEEFEANLPSTVTVLQTPFGSKVYLVGTAHFSEESQDDVSFVIRNVRPDVVMVELCNARINILKLDEKTLLEEAKSFNYAKLRSIIRTNGYIYGVFFILLLQMSAQVAKDVGMAPGGEFRRAFDEIQRLPNCALILGDRPIRITLQRAVHALSFWQTLKLVWRIGFNDTISIEEVEECKQSDLMEKLLKELAGEYPAFSEVFVKERDMYLCHSLQLASLPKPSLEDPAVQRPVRVVGVVGIGHAKGIAKYWGRVDPDWIPALMKIPEPSKSTKFLKFAIKYGLISLAVYGAFKFIRPRLQRLT